MRFLAGGVRLGFELSRQNVVLAVQAERWALWLNCLGVRDDFRNWFVAQAV